MSARTAASARWRGTDAPGGRSAGTAGQLISDSSYLIGLLCDCPRITAQVIVVNSVLSDG